MVRSDKERPLLVKLDKSLQFQAWLTPAVWLMRLVFIAAFMYAYFFPKSKLNDWFAMTQFSQYLIENRAKASRFHASFQSCNISYSPGRLLDYCINIDDILGPAKPT